MSIYRAYQEFYNIKDVDLTICKLFSHDSLYYHAICFLHRILSLDIEVEEDSKGIGSPGKSRIGQLLLHHLALRELAQGTQVPLPTGSLGPGD